MNQYLVPFLDMAYWGRRALLTALLNLMVLDHARAPRWQNQIGA